MSDIYGHPSPYPIKKTTAYSKAKIRASAQQIARSNSTVKIDKELVWRLVVAADGHLPTIAGVLGVAVSTVSSRLQGAYLAPRWRAWKAAQSEIRRKANQRRGWWRWRLRGMGIEPLQLDPTDPTWRACYTAPRGAAVRAAAAALAASGVDTRTLAGALAVVDAVADAAAADAAALQRLAGPPVDNR